VLDVSSLPGSAIRPVLNLRAGEAFQEFSLIFEHSEVQACLDPELFFSPPYRQTKRTFAITPPLFPPLWLLFVFPLGPEIKI